ncbi:MAG: polysaccharide export protein [Candidatus Omnitrophica bacterium]|nr:polysaccharide export protein [Candidatus Omnitrophota bacterium]
MKRVLAILALLAWQPAGLYAGDDNGYAGSPVPASYQTGAGAAAYQAQPGLPGPTGQPQDYGIVGYQPIPNEALPVFSRMNGQMPAPGQGYPQQPQTQRGMTYDYTMWLVGQGPYTLGRDDVIHIQVRNQPDFSGAFIIGPEGSIQYSYVGDIPIAGMTKYEVEQVIAKFLERYVRVPQVTVAILQYNSKAVYIIGEVNRPGKYIMRGDTIKLRDAIMAAGLPNHRAAMYRTHIVKPDLDHPTIRKINLRKMLYKGRIHNDIDLYPGEIVVVPSSVMSVVNDFLSQMLNPFTRAASTAALATGL